MSIRDQKLLYHLTSLDNLECILDYGLLARNKIENFDDVADSDIINFRQDNNLTQYVPFHFFANNPFDGRVQKNFPDKEFIYICIHREFAKNNNFKIIPKHPNAMKPLVLYNYLQGYEKIEWDIMDKRDYSDVNCKHICMAECLSQHTINHNDFSCIYVRNEDIKNYIEGMCDHYELSYNFYINSNPNMFVN
ncbi:DarT ssDNA thymidine ADP-ribosyltransferase family protein [Anabaena sp. WFMT]|uniref:DarT ssDNA thymidine ADP-ribosyltransferase family protein n=1 Tax=Anabaena sp. WFMT TaxID=3449730 RepID=UPI003F265158